MRKRPFCSLQAGRDGVGSIGDDPARVAGALRIVAERILVAGATSGRATVEAKLASPQLAVEIAVIAAT